ncbi:MAG: hypothetical protein RMX89_30105 [Nostoc sp. DedSLP04]|nr:hypothetical protein [Nostoc sp. DedSLP04]
MHCLSLRWCVSVAYRSYVYYRVGTRGQEFVLVDCDTALSLALSNLHIAIAQDNDLNILSELFEVFCRLHTRREFSGTGIGLAIYKKIVERYGDRTHLG